MKPIHYGRQEISDEDIAAVIETLKSDYLTQGPKIPEFESAFAHYVGSKYAVAVCNGTAALHLSAIVLGIKPGECVITTPITFAASANCIRYCSGKVLFADIDRDSYLIDLKKVDQLLSSTKEKIRGIVSVDFAGNPVNLEELKKIADRYGCWIIEDCCHAPGGWFSDRKGVKQKCGNALFANTSIFSFHPVKHFATGEGGMITTNDKNIYEKLLLLRTHGITKNPDLISENHGPWYYDMIELGYNYRLTDIQASLGISQLKRADKGLERRKTIAKNYDMAFRDYVQKIRTPIYSEGHAFHLYIIEIKDRLGLYNYLRENKIFSQVHYIPIHMLLDYKKLGYKKGDFPVSEDYYDHCLSLPMYPSLTNAEQDFVIAKVIEFFSR